MTIRFINDVAALFYKRFPEDPEASFASLMEDADASALAASAVEGLDWLRPLLERAQDAVYRRDFLKALGRQVLLRGPEAAAIRKRAADAWKEVQAAAHELAKLDSDLIFALPSEGSYDDPICVDGNECWMHSDFCIERGDEVLVPITGEVT